MAFHTKDQHYGSARRGNEVMPCKTPLTTSVGVSDSSAKFRVLVLCDVCLCMPVYLLKTFSNISYVVSAAKCLSARVPR